MRAHVSPNRTGPTKPRVLFTALYSASQAGTRLRAEAWCDALRARDLTPEVWSFFAPGDSERWFECRRRRVRALLLLKAVLRTVRLYVVLPRYDVVVVLREVAPVGSTALERRIAARSMLVWDVDDAIWTPYPRMFLSRLPARLRRSEHKYVRIAELASDIWAGSDEIAHWCRQHTRAGVWVLPTVPELPPVPPALGTRHGAVWVGSSSTGGFLGNALAHLDDSNVSGLAVTAVGADVPSTGRTRVTSVRWSESAEDEALRSARVGLYPLDLDHPLAAARAGFKAVLYMAYGLPSIVTPVPAVERLVRHGVEGLHATTPEEWQDAVRLLLDDDETWSRMSKAARARSERDYCTRVWAPRVADRVVNLLAGPAPLAPARGGGRPSQAN
ncbi:MAG: glycosyltransferase family 4 protein [Frankiaceae bacterium]|nr:glycosyltransferase family 4 protein [Frankiaceae bacterium]